MTTLDPPPGAFLPASSSLRLPHSRAPIHGTHKPSPQTVAPESKTVSLLPHLLITLMTCLLPSLIKVLPFETFMLEFDLSPSCCSELGPRASLGDESGRWPLLVLELLGALTSQLIRVPCASGDPLSASAGPQAADSLSVVISISSATFHPTKCLTVVRCYCERLHAGSSTPGPGFFSGTKCPDHKNTAPGMGETNPNKEKNRHRSQHTEKQTADRRPLPTDMESPTTQTHNTNINTR